MHAAGYSPDWVAGTSIGAINAALIAGNAPEDRHDRLADFWSDVSSAGAVIDAFAPAAFLRQSFNTGSALAALCFGASGMFRPRAVPTWCFPATAPDRLSYYDTDPLRRSLERYVDFDRINAGDVRLSVGAVNVASGNVIYFDSRTHRIGPEHIMASGALPPGFPAVEIDGEFYWDGGLVSNTPLDHVLESEKQRDMMIFQVDLFSARGALPATMQDVEEREKDIRYSSRTRLNTDRAVERQRTIATVKRLLDKLPPELAEDADVARLRKAAVQHSVTIVQLIHRGLPHGRNTKDYEFSRPTMREHWAAGVADAVATLAQKDTFQKAARHCGVRTFDVSRPHPLHDADEPLSDRMAGGAK